MGRNFAQYTGNTGKELVVFRPRRRNNQIGHCYSGARSTDNGATWTAHAILNMNAGSDDRCDEAPQVITNGYGNWLAVWHSRIYGQVTMGTNGHIMATGYRLTNPTPIASVDE